MPNNTQTRKKGRNKRFTETSLREFDDFNLRYSKVYYDDYQLYFEGVNDAIQNTNQEHYKITQPYENDYVKNATHIINSLDPTTFKGAGFNIVIGMTIQIAVADRIIKQTKNKQGKIKFYNNLYQKLKSLFSNAITIHAFVNLDANLLVITMVPLVNERYMSYTKLARQQSRQKVGSEMLDYIRTLPLYKDIQADDRLRETVEWKGQVIREAAERNNLSNGALGLFVKIVYSNDTAEYNRTELEKNRNNLYGKYRQELITKGYIALERPKYGLMTNLPKKWLEWRLVVLL